MHYSESSQAEAGQQIDRIRQMNHPIPSALFSDNPDASSSPSNSQSVIPNKRDEGNNDQIPSSAESNDEMLQQFINGQQDSAQPGVPATYNVAHSYEDPAPAEHDQDFADEDSREARHQDREDEPEEHKLSEYELNEEYKESSNSQNYEADFSQERQNVEDMIRPNHQEESSTEASLKEDSLYDSKVVRRNEQFSTLEKDSSSGEPENYTTKRRTFTDSNYDSNDRVEDRKKQGTHPFGYDMHSARSANYNSFVMPGSYSEKSPYMASTNYENPQLTSSFLQLNQSRNSEKNSLNRTDSVSSFPVTNYEDSEFMIQAYQRK